MHYEPCARKRYGRVVRIGWWRYCASVLAHCQLCVFQCLFCRFPACDLGRSKGQVELRDVHHGVLHFGALRSIGALRRRGSQYRHRQCIVSCRCRAPRRIDNLAVNVAAAVCGMWQGLCRRSGRYWRVGQYRGGAHLHGGQVIGRDPPCHGRDKARYKNSQYIKTVHL